MPTSRRKLALLAEGSKAVDAKPTTPAESLYAPPNPDGSRKMCGNCMLWLGSKVQECFIFSEDVAVPADGICGYHVFGKGEERERPENHDPVPPELAGFDQVKGGTACDRCDYFEPTKGDGGKCAVNVDEDGAKALVEAGGCCTRWSRSG